MVFYRPYFYFFAAVLCVLSSAESRAQTALEPLNNRDLEQIEKGEGLVNQNPFNRLYEPLNAGSFIVYPLLELQGRYNDNVFANDAHKNSDFITNIKPSLIVQKPQGRHSFEARLRGNFQKAASENSEDVEDYEAMLRASLEARHDVLVPLSISYRESHVDRSQTRSGEISRTPLKSTTTNASGGIIYKPGRLSLRLIGRASQLRLENNTDILGGAPINRKNAERDVYDISLTTGYQFHPNWSPFIRAGYQREDFLRSNTGGDDQDNTLLRGIAGLNFDYKGLITGMFGAGVDYRDFDQDTTDNSTDLVLDAQITANVSRRTSITADLSRSSVTDNDIVSGLTSSSLDLELKHELRPDLFLIGTGGYKFDQFDNSTREDDFYQAGLSLQYISSPALRVALEYDYQTRDSTEANIDFARNVFILRLLGSL